MPIQTGAKGVTIGGVNYPPYQYIDWLDSSQEADAVQGGDAFYVPTRRLTLAQLQAVQALVDGTGVQVLPAFLGSYAGVVFDAGVGNVMPTMRAVLNAPTDVAAAAEITAGGAQSFPTIIDGSALIGAVIPLATGPVNITTVHVGHSNGVNMTLSLDATITRHEMVRFDFDAGDLVNAVRINFAPPRTAGRYVDVSCIGQKRAAA